jgi:hypothetical protein
MPPRSCADCRRGRPVSGALRCEEQRSNAIGGVIVIDIHQARRAAAFERICGLVAARCAFFQRIT